MINKRLLSLHFSNNAKTYEKYAKVQKKMANELMCKIIEHFNNRNEILNILDIGCGTGYITENLIKCFPNSKIKAIDIAPGMIDYAALKFKNFNNIEFLCLDFEEADIDDKYDLIISNATFQWFNNLDHALIKLKKMLNPRGIITFSSFGEKTFNELHSSYKMAKKQLNINDLTLPGQEFLNMKDINNILNKVFIERAAFKISTFENIETEYFKSVKDFFESIKKIGANNSNCEVRPNLKLIKLMIKLYEKNYKINKMIQATYHFIYFFIESHDKAI